MTVRSLVITLGVSFTVIAQAQTPPSFAGTWVFNPARSQNVGMMASMDDTSTIVQTPAQLTITDHARMQGEESTRETRIDLTGKPAMNTGPIGS